jgi:hypothetical protein
MSEFRINKVLFKIVNPKIKIWVSANPIEGFRKKRIAVFEGIAIPEEMRGQKEIFFSFHENQNASEVQINIDVSKYFLKPYVDDQLATLFKGEGLPTSETFVQGIQVWKYQREDARLATYDRFSLRQMSTYNIHKLELLISYDGKSLKSIRPLSELNTQSSFSKYFQENQLFEVRRSPIQDASQVYPILSIPMKREMNVPFEGSANKNTYLEYYKKVSSFYDTYLKGRILSENIHFYSEGFEIVGDDKIQHTRRVSNSLKFNGNSDYNIYSGLKNFGPYKVPDTANLRFIFIYKQHHRTVANQLFLAFKNGYANSFPGLKDYVKINFELADENKILIESDDPVGELSGKLEQYPFQDGLKYFAIYFTDHRRFESLDDNDEEYYQIKYILLRKEVLSQFIYHGNIGSPSFKFHLPNIAVAILAKLGGIPWKLDTVSSSNMVVGFGVKRLNDNTYLGNTLCFKDDGEFYKFETYQRADIRTLGEALRDSILRVIQHEHFVPDKLVIHYYKTLSNEEAEQIERVLKDVNLDIPFIVLTINDTRSKDYLFFDVSSKDIMPVSGTIVEIKYKSEYLLANNERHSDTQLYSIRKFPFPLKIKINKPSNTLYDVFEVKELIDQVYSFSRIYWKSIGQVSLPVTIAYSKIVADLAAHFPDHRLPEQDIAHSNLWFL